MNPRRVWNVPNEIGLCPSSRELIMTPVLPRLAAPLTSAMTHMAAKINQTIARGGVKKSVNRPNTKKTEAKKNSTNLTQRETCAVMPVISATLVC